MASFNQTAGTRTQARNNTQAIVVTAMCIALTYIFTAVVNIRLPFAPNGGLIHLGNVPLFLAAIIFGKKTGALSGAFGMGLFDLFSGWTAWAPFTFIIVGLMGFSVGAITEKKKRLWLENGCNPGCMRDQNCRILHRRRYHLR